MQLTKMPKYDAYKDSEEGWFDKFPSHWNLNKLKNIFYEKKHIKNMSLNCGAISFGEVIFKDDNKIPNSTKASYQEVLSGEFLINPLNLNYDLISLRIALSNIDVVVSAGYIVLKNKIEINKNYFKYLLHRYDVAYMKLLGSGVRQTINFNHIANSLLPFPPTHEQTLIAKFLDQKTAQIDKAIEIKHKQIALLKEQKQIVINNAVTKGLDPTAPMKDSGVEWIGEIPEGWEVRRLKNAVDINAKSLQENTSKNHLIEYVDIGSVTFENGIVHKEKYMFRDAPSRARRLVSLGDTVVSTVRTYLKAICLVDENNIDSVFSTGFATLTPKSILDSYFLASFIKSNSFTNQVDIVSKGMSYPAINSTELSNLSIIIPSLLEQQQIVAYIDEKTSKIDKAIELQNKQIDKLKEYKASLINSVVTGKVRVTDEMVE